MGRLEGHVTGRGFAQPGRQVARTLFGEGRGREQGDIAAALRATRRTVFECLHPGAAHGSSQFLGSAVVGDVG
ncbi:hypothetical protein SC81_22955, partial [Vibrio vulnificus]